MWINQQPEPKGKDEHQEGILLEAVIEIPLGSFPKRGSAGQLDFVSPFPCPFHYGSVEAFAGLKGGSSRNTCEK
ncbi:MAG TPA: hypothetical protein PK820_10110 [Candidatus Competibacteraceae bacterium]|nr:hypothetical protein [Candidatus Competibacteraceae bacterium]MCP5134889.1 hypothetical protein [Gammaproteobacteria bacterium]HPF59134.1 hypothetical protein [Candidatus Competibacteraceae bacterium]